MPKLLYAVACHDIIIDRETGATSFIRTIEHAVVQEFPVTLPALYVGCMWELDDDKDFSVAIHLTGPDGKSETLGVQEVPSPGTVLHKLNFHIPGIRVQQEGKHLLGVALRSEDGWEAQIELPIFIFKNPETTPTE